MKIAFSLTIFIVFANVSLICRAQSTTVAGPTPYTVVHRDANERIWEKTTYERSPSGKIVPRVHHYVELGSGICYSSGRQWLDSQEQINILPDGSGAATNARYSAYFPIDIHEGAIKVVGPDWQLRSQPIGIAYDDGTNTVLIGTLTNSIGELRSTNEVAYENAFSDVDADLLYTYKFGSFEQFVVLRGQLPSPESLGLSPRANLQVWTEFFDSPTPVQETSAASQDSGLTDTTLIFGSTKFDHGRAFVTGKDIADAPPNPRSQTPIYKSWLNIQGRTFLIESVPYQQIKAHLGALSARPNRGRLKPRFAENRTSPIFNRGSGKHASSRGEKLQTAGADLMRKAGYAFDYIQITAAQTNFTFASDTTYSLTAECNFYGITTFEGGTVIKLARDYGQVNIEGNTSNTINCDTSEWRPAIFTSVNDNSVGEAIGSGNPTFGDVFLFMLVYPTNAMLHDMRFSYGDEGIYAANALSGPGTLSLRNCQLIDMGYAIMGYNVGLYNVLMTGIVTNYPYYIEIYGPNFTAQNVTADGGTALIADFSNGSAQYSFTNCLITDLQVVSPNGLSFTPQTNCCVFLQSPTNPVYQTVAGGNYYLTNGSPYRAVGTTNIDPTLFAELAQRTTWPPIVYDSTNISLFGALGPQAPRDTNTYLDIGYHYDPIDYLFGGCDLATNLVVDPGTVLGWFNDYDVNGVPDGITLNDGANLSFSGTVTEPCIFAQYTMVQERGNINWYNTSDWASGAVTFYAFSSEPLLSASFTKFVSDGTGTFFRDYSPGSPNLTYGACGFLNSEFYAGSMSTYNMQYMNSSNCLFFRNQIDFWDQNYAISYTFENCTFYNGGLFSGRYNGDPFSDAGLSSSFWMIENCSFDGTAFSWSDCLNADSTNTLFDYNSYNTSNLNWTNFSSYYGTNEVIGPNDMAVTNYGWQASWLGNFYLPPNSPLINAGSTYADALRLYEFTTQTNQVKQGITIVDIGYHYVALGPSGLPLSTYTNGVADYVYDPSGNGIPDWWQLQYYGFTGLNPNIVANSSGMNILQAYKLGMNPAVDESASSGNRANYSYDPGGWFQQVFGIFSGTAVSDNEGNLQSASQ